MNEKPRESDEFNPYAPPASAEPGRGSASLPEGVVPVTQVSYRLVPEDIREAQRGVHATEVKIGKFIIPLIGFVTFVAVVYFNSGPSRPGQIPDPAPSTGIGTVLAFLPALALPASIVLVIWMRIARRREKDSPHEITTVIGPEGISIRESDFFEAKTAWNRCNEIRETPTIILFFTRSFDPARGKDVTAAAYPVPKRAFATPEAAASFLEAARRWHAEATAEEAT